MSNELSTKDSEKLAKIRKDAKLNKVCIRATEAFECVSVATSGSILINSIITAVDNEQDKISKVYSDSSLSNEEKEKEVKKIKRNTKIRKGLITGLGCILAVGYGYVKEGATQSLLNHETDHMNKRIFQVVKPKNTTAAPKGSK